jgi:hypothetical protein
MWSSANEGKLTTSLRSPFHFQTTHSSRAKLLACHSPLFTQHHPTQFPSYVQILSIRAVCHILRPFLHGSSWTSSNNWDQIFPNSVFYVVSLWVPVLSLFTFLGFSFFFKYWGLNSGPSLWATLPALFCERYFWDRISRTTCPGLTRNHEPPNLCSWAARIIGVSHWHQLPFFLEANSSRYPSPHLGGLCLTI